MSPFDQIRRLLKSLKVDDALVFLNFILHASEDPRINTTIYKFCRQHAGAVTDYKIEFLSKWLIICSEYTSNAILSPKELDWNMFLKLSELYNQINDPFVADKKSSNEHPMNLIIRMCYQQLTGQQRIMLQSFGSASLLYERTGSYDIPGAFQKITGLSIREFMQLGMVLLSAKAGPYKTAGTLCQSWIDKGIGTRIDVLDNDRVQCFLNVAGCDYDRFRITAGQSPLKVCDDNYILYEFNPFAKYPFVKIHPQRWVAPSPGLVVDRITSGIYYDLLDKSGKSFTDSFGPIFEDYVGELLCSVYPKEKVAKEQQYGTKRNRKKGPADWSIIDDPGVIFVECKSFSPNLSMKSMVLKTDVEKYTHRIADAVEQVYRHIHEIISGNPELKKFQADKYMIVVLTLGRLQIVNTYFFKTMIVDCLEKRGISKPSFVVLSLQEFENYLSLAEKGVQLSELLEQIMKLGRIDAMKPYTDMLRQNAVPKIVAQRGKEVLDVV